MSRARWLPLTAALWACGSPPAPEPPVAPSTLGLEEHLARIDDLAARGCACEDRRCVGAVDRELAALVRGVQLVPGDPGALTTTVPERVTRLEELSVCMTDHEVAATHYGEALLTRAEELREQACDCKDRPCAKALSVSLAPELESADWFPIEYEVYEQIKVHARKIESCAGPNPLVDQAIRDLDQLRADACACTDAACASSVQTRFDAFLETHRDTVGMEEEAIEIGDRAKAMSECLGRARTP